MIFLLKQKNIILKLKKRSMDYLIDFHILSL